jgi:hypothetical protein
MEKKFYFTDNTLTYNKSISHACDIRQSGQKYDIIIRGIIYPREKIIYLRLNDFTFYFGIEQKKLQYQFNKNLTACEIYLKKHFKSYQVYNSYSIAKLPLNIQKEILNT